MATLKLVSADGSVVELAEGRTMLGRDPSCEQVIDDRSVSRRHAFIEQQPDGWSVTDQGSANGTFVDGQQVSHSALQDGQELRLGMVAFRVELEQELAGTVMMRAPEHEDRTHMMPAAGAARPAPPKAPARPPAVQRQEQPADASYDAPGGVASAGDAGMSPEEHAAAILGVPPGASAYDVRERYQQLTLDLKAKLAQARTPHLKATYEKNLRELQEAADLVAPGILMESSSADLPALQPSVALESLGHTRPQRAVAAPLPPPAAAASSGPPALAVFLGFAAVGLFVVSAFFFLSKGKFEKSLTTLEGSTDLATMRADAKKFATTEKLVAKHALVNGKLKLCNRSPFPLEVTWLGAVFVEPEPAPAANAPATGKEYRVGTFNSRACDLNFRMTLHPGGEQLAQVEKCPSNGGRYDGSALTYAVSVKRPDMPEPVWISGLQNNREDCVKIGEGWTAAPPPAASPAPPRGR